MPDESRELRTITSDDVKALSKRLEEWGRALPEQEQLVLGWVLTRAAAADDIHVNAYAEQTSGGVPVSSLMAEAAGLQADDVSGYGIPIHGAAPAPWPPPTWAFKFGR